MSKPNQDHTDEEQVFEIIELAIDEMDLLTRAFDVIAEACDYIPEPRVDIGLELSLIHI